LVRQIAAPSSSSSGREDAIEHAATDKIGRLGGIPATACVIGPNTEALIIAVLALPSRYVRAW
jgi:hypothetical protein